MQPYFVRRKFLKITINKMEKWPFQPGGAIPLLQTSKKRLSWLILILEIQELDFQEFF